MCIMIIIVFVYIRILIETWEYFSVLSMPATNAQFYSILSEAKMKKVEKKDF